MNQSSPIHSFNDLLSSIRRAADQHDQLSIGQLFEILGTRSYGPILLLIGAVLAAPVVGDIPGVPIVLGAVLTLITGQLLFHKKHIWLPNWLLRRSVSSEKINKTIAWLQKPADKVDTILRPRLRLLTSHPSVVVIMIISIILSLLTPAMAVVILSANVAGLILLLFGLALISSDGLMALLGYLCCLGLVALLLWGLL